MMLWILCMFDISQTKCTRFVDICLQADFNHMCLRVPPWLHYDINTLYPSQELLQTFTTQHTADLLMGDQRFTDESGLQITYPVSVGQDKKDPGYFESRTRYCYSII